MNKQIKEMPKIVLHLHLDGSLRPETVNEWIGGRLEETKKALMVEKDCRNLNEYLEKFDLPIKVLQTKEHIERATFELYEDLAKQNVIYAEVRFAPSLHLNCGLTYEEVVESAICGLNKAKKQYEIEGNLILCCMRGEGENNKLQNIQTVKVAKKFLNKGVCGVDLAGAEALFKTENFEYVFKLAKELDIPYTIHAGEADGPESIKKALEFGALRIGHGVRCIEDENLILKLVENKIPLEVCPVSNIQTRAIDGKHPLETLFKNNVLTTINTDNNTVSNTNILEEYEYVLKNFDLQIEDLITMNKYATQNIFDSLEKRNVLLEKIENYKNNL